MYCTYSTCFYLQCLENYRESKLKVFLLFRTFFKLSNNKARYFCNVFDIQTFSHLVTVLLTIYDLFAIF